MYIGAIENGLATQTFPKTKKNIFSITILFHLINFSGLNHINFRNKMIRMSTFLQYLLSDIVDLGATLLV